MIQPSTVSHPRISSPTNFHPVVDWQLKEAKVRIQPMMRKPLYLALAKNLERTRFILEVLLCFCSASHSFRSVIQSEDALALFHELPVEVLHLFAGKHINKSRHHPMASI